MKKLIKNQLLFGGAAIVLALTGCGIEPLSSLSVEESGSVSQMDKESIADDKETVFSEEIIGGGESVITEEESHLTTEDSDKERSSEVLMEITRPQAEESKADSKLSEDWEGNKINSDILGNWEGVTFRNPWSHLAITVPQDAIVFSRAQMPDAVKMQENQTWDMLVMLSDWDSQICLYYEKTEALPVNLDEFLMKKFEELVSPQGLEHQINGWSDAVLGGENYRRLETSVLTHKYTDFYVREQSGYVIVLSVRYTLGREEEMKTLIDQIERV